MSTDLAFPQEALVGSLGDLAKTLAKGTEVPEEFYFACGLTMLGHAAGTGLTLAIGAAVEPRLFTVLLGESYSVKKSTAMRKTIDFFDKRLNESGVLYGVGSAEGLLRELEANGNLVLAYDELRALVDKCGVKGSTLLPMVTSLFESNCWQNSTKNERHSTFVDNAHLSLLGCCTRETYEHIWRRDAIAIGLPNRLFVVNAEAKGKVAWPAKPDEERLDHIALEIKKQLRRLPLELGMTQSAQALWEEWYNNLPCSEHVRRLDTIGFRLLALIALSTDKEEIDADTVQVVTSILNYELEMRILTDPIDTDNTIARLEEKIRRVLGQKGPMSERDLRRAIHADRDGLWAFTQAKKKSF